MKTIKQILTWLSGKKGIIASIIGGISAYLATKGVIGEAEVILISALSLAIFGSASIATGKVVYNK